MSEDKIKYGGQVHVLKALEALEERIQQIHDNMKKQEAYWHKVQKANIVFYDTVRDDLKNHQVMIQNQGELLTTVVATSNKHAEQLNQDSAQIIELAKGILLPQENKKDKDEELIEIKIND